MAPVARRSCTSAAASYSRSAAFNSAAACFRAMIAGCASCFSSDGAVDNTGWFRVTAEADARGTVNALRAEDVATCQGAKSGANPVRRRFLRPHTARVKTACRFFASRRNGSAVTNSTSGAHDPDCSRRWLGARCSAARGTRHQDLRARSSGASDTAERSQHARRNAVAEKPRARARRTRSGRRSKQQLGPAGYAARHGLSYVDPAQELKAFVVAGEPIYFAAPEIHWARQGHHRAGLVRFTYAFAAGQFMG